jgi:SAM-dependent methyltransferase
VKHPAKWNPEVFVAVEQMIAEYACAEHPLQVLDPFAGAGGIHDLEDKGLEIKTWGVELEPEWAKQRRGTLVGDATDLWMFPDNEFDVIATSPVFGNRMSDHHNAKDNSKRHTYRHYLGRMPSEGSSAILQFGPEYRRFHRKAWKEAIRVLKPGGIFIVNIGDHIRKHKRVPVSKWHYQTLKKLGLEPVEIKKVTVRKLRHGKNYATRIPFEHVMVFRKPSCVNPEES